MKRWILIMVVCMFAVTYVVKDKGMVTKLADTNKEVRAAIVMDTETGTVLYEEDSQKLLPIASMSKLMTQYLVLNALEKGALSWEQTYRPSDHVLEMTQNTSVVKLGMSPSKAYSVSEMFTAMTVISANDAASALAEMVGGTEESFVSMMNEQAKAFGMMDTTFFTASGLDGNYIGKGKEYTNISSARDVATIAQQLLLNHPEILEFTKMTDFTTSEGIRLWSTNQMLAGMPHAMPGIDGLKTGYTKEAGSCFASTGVFNGKRIVSVVIGVNADGEDRTSPRFNVTRDLIEQYVLN
ncbi:D-alanyl-D-alanine carboxypeptidase family protein [Sporosarcina sp. CAU 1771]